MTQKDVAAGQLDMLILATLAKGPTHGYGVIEEIRRRSLDLLDLSEGSVYPALHRLESNKFLASRWDEGKTKQRRIYRLTAKGRREMARRLNRWQKVVTGVNAVVEST